MPRVSRFTNPPWAIVQGEREPWVYEWVIYLRKYREMTWAQIGDNLGCAETIACQIYKERMGRDAYTGPLPEWKDDGVDKNKVKILAGLLLRTDKPKTEEAAMIKARQILMELDDRTRVPNPDEQLRDLLWQISPESMGK